MAASCEGHVDIVRILIEAKAQIDIQNEVRCPILQKTHYVHNCVCSYVTTYMKRVILPRKVRLLFTWQLKEAKLMW